MRFCRCDDLKQSEIGRLVRRHTSSHGDGSSGQNKELVTPNSIELRLFRFDDAFAASVFRWIVIGANTMCASQNLVVTDADTGSCSLLHDMNSCIECS